MKPVYRVLVALVVVGLIGCSQEVSLSKEQIGRQSYLTGEMLNSIQYRYGLNTNNAQMEIKAIHIKDLAKKLDPTDESLLVSMVNDEMAVVSVSSALLLAELVGRQRAIERLESQEAKTKDAIIEARYKRGQKAIKDNY